jgi:hypothetical protein
MRSCPCAARRFAVVAVVVLLHVLPALADESAVTTTNSITGIVLDTGDATPLPGAEVRLVELGRVVFTDADGRFEFRRVPRGTFTLGVHLPGFSSHHGAVSIPLADPLTIELSATRFEDEITVSASPFAVNRLEVAQQVDIVSGQDVKRESTASPRPGPVDDARCRQHSHRRGPRHSGDPRAVRESYPGAQRRASR